MFSDDTMIVFNKLKQTQAWLNDANATIREKNNLIYELRGDIFAWKKFEGDVAHKINSLNSSLKSKDTTIQQQSKQISALQEKIAILEKKCDITDTLRVAMTDTCSELVKELQRVDPQNDMFKADSNHWTIETPKHKVGDRQYGLHAIYERNILKAAKKVKTKMSEIVKFFPF